MTTRQEMNWGSKNLEVQQSESERDKKWDRFLDILMQHDRNILVAACKRAERCLDSALERRADNALYTESPRGAFMLRGTGAWTRTVVKGAIKFKVIN